MVNIWLFVKWSVSWKRIGKSDFSPSLYRLESLHRYPGYPDISQHARPLCLHSTFIVCLKHIFVQPSLDTNNWERVFVDCRVDSSTKWISHYFLPSFFHIFSFFSSLISFVLCPWPTCTHLILFSRFLWRFRRQCQCQMMAIKTADDRGRSIALSGQFLCNKALKYWCLYSMKVPFTTV